MSLGATPGQKQDIRGSQYNGNLTVMQATWR